ncbi:YciI family protein [Prosthecomicrobium pneumaticum]|uniref:YCII-related domain-containing protein n=1 Tax=Prosthecomicrobium pneumaticum TaxID=81895 RepID=A0A7W9CUW1_9HYPH|nr:YciI family protein [Prosthecomicrobium pneumaticum]MBB5751956.1 hypothetical protein [Prosthecomicrobium pneumaticum]
MRFLCLVYVDGATFEGFGEQDHRRLIEESLAYDAGLTARGHFVAADALVAPSEAVTVRVRGGRVATAEGPYAADGPQLGGFLLIDARDLAEAAEIAAGVPMARHGGIEVRPVMPLG